MKIGVDVRALQIGHQYRGIGEVVKRTLDDILVFAENDNNKVIFYRYDDLNDPLDLLKIPEDLKYEVIYLGNYPTNAGRTKVRKFIDNFNLLYGEPIKHTSEVDVFLQYDYNLGVSKNTKTILVEHDIIPFIFWNQFFESPKIPLKNRALRTTIRTIFHNYRSKRMLKRSLRNAKKIITVSEYTRNDINAHFSTPLSKMTTIHLGVSTSKSKNRVVSKIKMPSKPFLLYIGAVDKRRRRVDDLVAAFNNLKADGHDIQLILVGENFKSDKSIPDGPVRAAVMSSSYKDDIKTFGYIDDQIKQELFKEAIAFVFPSVYEGFGIPILEAMLFRCPVVTYKNTSITEIAGRFAMYAPIGWYGIYNCVNQLIRISKNDRETLTLAAKNHASQFTWKKTARKFYNLIVTV